MSARRPTIVGVVVFLLFILHYPVQADIRINEFSPQTNPEWVELYNPDVETHTLSGMVLYFADSSDTSQKVLFCSGTTLSGKTYGRVVRPDGSYWLSNAGDTLMMKREDDVIDSITFGDSVVKAPIGTQSATRNTEGVWSITDSPSPSGEIINLVCPTVTPTNAPVATITNTPIAGTGNTSVSPTVVRTFTATPTVKPTSFVRIIETVLVDENKGTVGAILGTKNETPAQGTESADEVAEKRPYIVALLFVGIGMALVAAVSVIKIRYTK